MKSEDDPSFSYFLSTLNSSKDLIFFFAKITKLNRKHWKKEGDNTLRTLVILLVVIDNMLHLVLTGKLIVLYSQFLKINFKKYRKPTYY